MGNPATHQVEHPVTRLDEAGINCGDAFDCRAVEVVEQAWVGIKQVVRIIVDPLEWVVSIKVGLFAGFRCLHAGTFLADHFGDVITDAAVFHG